ncbi:MAG: hypothetical protein AAAC47_02090 [Pararhizobium sp.]
MPLIECIAGPVETTIGGTNYQFHRDKHARFVTEVHNPTHVECFLGVVHYRLAEEPVEDEADDEADNTPPALIIPPAPLKPAVPIVQAVRYAPPVPLVPQTPPIVAKVPEIGSNEDDEAAKVAKAAEDAALAAAIQASADRAAAVHRAQLAPGLGQQTPAPVPPVVPVVVPSLGEQTAPAVTKPAGNRAARRRGKK